MAKRYTLWIEDQDSRDRGVHRRDFGTDAERQAFIDGMAFVNDSAITWRAVDPGDGRLHCCQCGADLGSAEDPYRDPDCMECLNPGI
jgi:hypothetical protein